MENYEELPKPTEEQIKKEEEDYQDQEKSGKKQKEEWKCLDCKKSYKSYPAFYTHNKLKHDGKPPKEYDIPRSLEDIRKDRGRPRVTDSSQRIKFTIQDKHQQKCEDNIYEFLGKLGQKGDESGQRDNTVIRGYLKKPIDPANTFPLDVFQINPNLYQDALQVQEKIKQLSEELANRNEWEFVDPLELKPDDMTEFSVYNLKSLFYILKEEDKINKYTTLVVFFIWVSKELLESAYREIVILCLVYIKGYWEQIAPLKQNVQEFQQQQVNEQIRQQRTILKDNFFKLIMDNYRPYKLQLFDDQSEIQNFLEKFLMWYYHFDDSDSMDNQEIQNNYNQYGESNHLDEDEEGELDDDDQEDHGQQLGQAINQPGGDSTTHINPENLQMNGN